MILIFFYYVNKRSRFHCICPIKNKKNSLDPGFNFKTNYIKFDRIRLYPMK